MLHPSTKRLIDKLNEMTRKQRVTWTEGENAALVHDTEGYRVVLTPEPHAVLLTDALGREIETCLPEEFADEVDAQGRPYSKFIAELYREAARHARGTEKAIRTLLAGLDAAEAEAPPPAPIAPIVPAVAVLDAPDGTTDETASIESETEITAAVANLADRINAPGTAAPPVETVIEEPAAPEPEPVPEIVAFTEQPAPEPEMQVVPEAEEPDVELAPAGELSAEPVSPDDISPAAEEGPQAEEPGSFGTFGAFEPDAALSELALEPEPEPVVIDASAELAPAAELDIAETVLEIDAAPEPAQAEFEPESVADPEPVPAPAPATPALTQPISLSSIPFGFGLGAAQRAGAPSHPSTSSPEPETAPLEAPVRLVIDGTLDLPDVSPDEYDDAAAADPYPPPAPEAGPRDLPSENAPPAPEPGNPRRFNPWN